MNFSVIFFLILEYYFKIILMGYLVYCIKFVLIVLMVIYMLWCFILFYLWDIMIKMVY